MNKFTYKLNRFITYPYRAIKSSILCIRFPFLYTRNRFSGLHYNNWKFQEFVRNIQDKYWHSTKNKPEAFYYLGEFHFETFDNYMYWDNWWAKPICKIAMWFHNIILQIIHCVPTRTELDAMPNGWRKAFGIQMCKEIKQAQKRIGGRKAIRALRINQIKEKWGRLCFYCDNATVETNKIIHKYEYISEHTCINCGRPATVITKGYISPYCDECVPRSSKNNVKYESTEFGLECNPWYGYTGNINGRDSKEWDSIVEINKLDENKENF